MCMHLICWSFFPNRKCGLTSNNTVQTLQEIQSDPGLLPSSLRKVNILKSNCSISSALEVKGSVA